MSDGKVSNARGSTDYHLTSRDFAVQTDIPLVVFDPDLPSFPTAGVYCRVCGRPLPGYAAPRRAWEILLAPDAKTLVASWKRKWAIRSVGDAPEGHKDQLVMSDAWSRGHPGLARAGRLKRTHDRCGEFLRAYSRFERALSDMSGGLMSARDPSSRTEAFGRAQWAAPSNRLSDHTIKALSQQLFSIRNGIRPFSLEGWKAKHKKGKTYQRLKRNPKS